MNQIIEDYLQIYTSEDQTVWAKLLSLAQFVYNNSCNHTTKMSSNQLLHSFNCEIHIDVVDNVTERRISAAKDHIERLHQLWQKLHLWLVKIQEQMAIYYNVRHVLKQFKIENFIKLSIKNLKLKCHKLSSCWIGLFWVLEQIRDQAYRLALSDKYARLHSVFPVQLLENYCHCHDDAELMMMPDLENPQDEWKVKEVWNK